MKAVMTADDQMRKMNVPELKIAGKTGTAEYPGSQDAKGILPTHGWFTSFAPYDDPQVSVTVFLQSGGGPTNAAPVAMKIMKRYFNYTEPPRRQGGGGGAEPATGCPRGAGGPTSSGWMQELRGGPTAWPGTTVPELRWPGGAAR